MIPAEPSTKNRYQLLIILLIVFMGFVGVAMPYPIFPPLFLHPQYNSIIPSHWHAHYRSIFLGITLALYPLGQFFGSPILGAYSDRYGRKRILLASIAGTALGYLLSALALHYDLLWLLIVSRFITGTMEGNISIARSMVVDLKHLNKQKCFGLINGATAIGFVVGPMLGGFLSDHALITWFSMALPFYLAFFITLVTLIFAIFKLQETRAPNVKLKLSLIREFNVVLRLRVLFKNKVLKHLLITGCVFYLGVDMYYEFGPVYLTARWLMTPAQISIFNIVLSATLAFGNAWLVYRLAQVFSSKKLIKTGMGLTAVVFGTIVLVSSKIFVLFLFAFSGLTISVAVVQLTLAVSNAASEEIQGEVLGTQWGLRMLGDSIICLMSGVLILVSASIPLILSVFIALIAVCVYSLLVK